MSSNGDDGKAAANLLAKTVQALSLAIDVPAVQGLVKSAARRLTRCDGATFVLLQDGRCYYADEDAIAPLWKGRSFPLDMCISGWVIRNARPAVIEDIYADPRIPHDAYRPTFVRSLAMVPIRMSKPLGAIGNYWASPHTASQEELDLLQALADSASAALEIIRLLEENRVLVNERTTVMHRARTNHLP